MKKAIILLSALIVCTFPCYSQQVTASVDERFELTSIVFRLAGVNKEYQKCDFEQYANDIDEYFAPYADHELLEYIRELRTKNADSLRCNSYLNILAGDKERAYRSSTEI